MNNQAKQTKVGQVILSSLYIAAKLPGKLHHLQVTFTDDMEPVLNIVNKYRYLLSDNKTYRTAYPRKMKNLFYLTEQETDHLCCLLHNLGLDPQWVTLDQLD